MFRVRPSPILTVRNAIKGWDDCLFAEQGSGKGMAS